MFVNYLVGLVAFGSILLPAGFVIAAATNPCDFRTRSLSEQVALSILTAIATLPILTYYVIRVFPSAAAPVFAFVSWPLALYYLLHSRRPGRSIFSSVRPMLGWTLVALFIGLLLADIRVGDQLQLGPEVYDYGARVSVTDAITRTGIPPANPSFYDGRPQPLFYYYFWFAVCSLVDRATGQLIGPDGSLKASVFWGVASVVALVQCVLFSGAVKFPDGAGRRWLAATAVGLLISGLDLLPVAAGSAWRLVTHETFHLPYALAMWNGEGHVSSWFGVFAWVPNHVVAFVSGMFSLLLLRKGAELPFGRSWRLVALAGLGFASTAGMSIWVAIVAAAVAAAWCLVSICLRWYREAALVVLAGSASVLVALPYLLGLAGTNHLARYPLALWVRPFGPLGPLEYKEYGPFLMMVIRLALLPVTYAVGFGFFLIALVPYLRWRRWSCRAFDRDDLFWLICAVVPIIVCSLFTSTVRNNDFGWRGLLFTQFVLLVYALPAIIALLFKDSLSESFALGRRGLLIAAMTVGLLGTCYDAVALRLGMYDERSGRSAVLSTADYRTHAARIRDALAWIADNTPRAAIIQQNPGEPGSAAGILASYYQRRQVILSDWDLGTQYGVSDNMYKRLLLSLSPIFASHAPLSNVVAAINADHIDYVVVTARDSIWNETDSWSGSVNPIYANPEVKIFSAAALRRAAKDR